MNLCMYMCVFITLKSGPLQELNAALRAEIDALGGAKAALAALAEVCLTRSRFQRGLHGTMRSMCGADAGCLAITYQSLWFA